MTYYELIELIDFCKNCIMFLIKEILKNCNLKKNLQHFHSIQS